MADKQLPRRQDALLRLIAGHERTGMVPAAAVLAEEMGLAGESSVTPALRALEGKGFLHVEGGVRGRQRFIRLTDRARRYLGDGLPVLGSIPAGPADEMFRDARLTVHRLEDLLEWEPGDFLLEVEGDSMADDGILSGDLVLLRPGLDPVAGEVAAVWVEDEGGATLKRVYPDPDAGTIRLRAAQPGFPDSEHPVSEVRYAGVMRGLVRRAEIA